MSERARRVLIVGASAAGLRCACRLARLDHAAEVLVVEARRVFSYAACGLPYVLSGDVAEAAALRRTLDGSLRDEAYFGAVKGVTVRSGTRMVGVDVGRHAARVQDEAGDVTELAWDELVIASGARPRTLPGQPVHPRVVTFHTIDDLAPLQEGLARGALGRVAIIGAGLVGCELVEAFRGLWGAEVTLIEAAARPLPGLLDGELAGIAAAALERNGVRLLTDNPVERIQADNERVTVVAGGERVVCDAAVVAVGLEPVVALARQAGVTLGVSGAIAVDEQMATSVPHVWAAGDCVEVTHAVTGAGVHLPLGSLANRQGRVLGSVLAGLDERFPPVAGAMAVKVFDTNVAAVGISMAVAGKLGIDARRVWVMGHDRAHYWPEARELAIQLLYEPASGRVLGVQAAGEGDVTKRVDVAAQLIARGATLAELARIEHAYAPPFAPAIDPLAVAAFVAENQENGIESRSPLDEMEGVSILDVRRVEERRRRPVHQAELHEVPLEALRQAGPGCEGEVVVVCERGSRAAEAVTWLVARGVPASYLGGGLRLREQAGAGRRP